MIPGVPTMRLLAGLMGLVAAVSAGWLIQDRFHQKGLADAAQRCARAAADAEDMASLAPCLEPVRDEVMAARQGRVCEAALLPSLRPESRFAMQQACGAGIKRLVAQGDAAASERDSLAGQLSQARAESAAAVTRAESRAARQTQRTDHAERALQAAPRDGAGRIRCDAECLRRIAG